MRAENTYILDTAYTVELQDMPSGGNQPVSYQPILSEDEAWRALAMRFDDLCDALQLTRFETKAQAVGVPVINHEGERSVKTVALLWSDPDCGEVRPWFQIPFDPSIITHEWEEKRSSALELCGVIQSALEGRTLTPRFAMAWGKFCEIGALFENAWFSDRKPLNHLKGGVSQDKTPQLIWYSKLYKIMEANGKVRRHIDADIAILIEDIISGKLHRPPDFPAHWYREILHRTTKGELASSFRQNKLPRKENPSTNGM